MKNKAIYPSIQLVKLIFFIIVQIVTAICVIGILPTIVLAIAFWISCRDRNVSPLIKSSFAVKVFIYIIVIVGSIFQIWDSFGMSSGFTTSEACGLVALWFICAIAYHVILNTCLISPSQAYVDFLKKKDSQIDNNRIYSIADKLIKLKELKDHGLISEDEFLKRKDELKNT
jgi:uncharacterized membrane protein